VTEHRIRLDRPSPGIDTTHRRHERADLRRQADRFAVVRLGGVVGRVRVIVPESRGQGPERVHPVARGKRPHETEHRFRKRSSGDELGLQIAELGPRRQPAVPQQVADFFERGVAGEIVDVVAAIGQHAAIAIEVADR